MPRFLADCNVGRLARWLRALGYDADYEPLLDDRRLVARALAEERVLLTRDRELCRRRAVSGGAVRAVLLAEDQVQDQLRQVVHELRLDADPAWTARALSRCLECNRVLEARPRAQVLDRVPPRVRLAHRRFLECPGCGRVYWPGSHWDRMMSRLAAL